MAKRKDRTAEVTIPLALGDAFRNIAQIKAILCEYGFEPSGVSMLDASKEVAEFYHRQQW